MSTRLQQVAAFLALAGVGVLIAWLLPLGSSTSSLPRDEVEPRTLQAQADPALDGDVPPALPSQPASVEVPDPCTLVKLRADDLQTADDVRELLRLMRGAREDCSTFVSAEARQRAALQVCAEGIDDRIPGTWARDALAEQIRSQGVRDTTPCLVGRAAEVGVEHAAELALLLVALAEALPAKGLRLQSEADEQLLLLTRALVSARPPRDTEWWDAFWDGMQDGGIKLRQYIYHTVAADLGVQELLTFVQATAAWEDTSGPLRIKGLLAAGDVLRWFQTSIPAAPVLVPDSAKLRLVMVKSVPIRALGLDNPRPWFGGQRAQELILEAWGTDKEQSDELARDERRWRANYLANIWALAGHRAAMAMLHRYLHPGPDEDVEFTPEACAITACAVTSFLAMQEDAKHADRAGDIRRTLLTAFQAATSDALTQLIFRLRGPLTNSEFRQEMSLLLQDRMPQLHPRAHALLAPAGTAK